MTRPQGRRLARNAGLNLLGQGLPLLAALPAIPLLVRGAGTERFGLLTIAWVLVGYVSLFDFGMGRALTHAVADRVGRRREAEVGPVVRIAVRATLALSLLAGAGFWLAAPWAASRLEIEPALAREVVWAMRAVAAGVPVVVLAAVLRGALEGLERFGVVNAIRVPLGVATFLAPLAVLPWTSHLGALVGALVAARSLGWAAYAWAVRRSLQDAAFRQPARPDARSLSGLLRYGGWATVSNLISPLMVHFDRLVIGASLSAAAVAFYATPFEVVNRLLMIPGAVVTAFFPAFTEGRAAGREGSASLFRGSVQGILLLLLPPAVLLFAFAGEGLTLWVGEAFTREGTAVARWLLVGTAVNAVAFVPFVLLQGIARPDVTARIHMVEVPFYAAALLWALPRYGITGAAAVWTGRVALDLVLLLVTTARLAPDLRGEAVRAGLLLAPALVLLVLPLALPHPVAWGVLVLAVALAAAVAGWRWSRAPRDAAPAPAGARREAP